MFGLDAVEACTVGRAMDRGGYQPHQADRARLTVDSFDASTPDGLGLLGVERGSIVLTLDAPMTGMAAMPP
jgi:hypothetical protein